MVNKFFDQNMVLTGGHDKILKLWDLRSSLPSPELIFDNSLENDIDFFHKTKSKSIYVGNYKNKNKPPILGFLQMNENSANTTLSSGFSEI